MQVEPVHVLCFCVRSNAMDDHKDDAKSDEAPFAKHSDDDGDDSSSRDLDGVEPEDDADAAGVTFQKISGHPSELWDPADFEIPMAPVFLGGGGISLADYREALKQPVHMAPFTPYVKPAPLTNLPLESFDLRIIYEAGKTGFEEAKEFPIPVGAIIAGRYQIVEFLGAAAFSRAVHCLDLKHNSAVCVKIIRNGKDMFDQGLDEVKMLQLLNAGCDPDEKHILRMFDFFYFKEHIFIVCELLRDNLYEFAKFNRERESEFYFTLPRIQSMARQVLTALDYVHSLNLLHCDLKPENILIKSYSRCEVKVIDFGNSCFTTDNLSSYVQSRCYRAPEVVLGCEYDGRIDIWSLGAILPELLTGHVLFSNTTVNEMLARIAAILGPFPPAMVLNGRHSASYFTKHGVIYGEVEGREDDPDEKLVYYLPQPAVDLAKVFGTTDAEFVDFVKQCLTLDPKRRPSAKTLLGHPFLSKPYA